MVSQDIAIQAKDGSGEFSAYLSGSENESGPGVVLIQEIFGVNAEMRRIADEFAEQGFKVCVPDLYWRQEPGIQLDSKTEEGREQAMALFQSFDRMKGLEDCVTAMAFLRESCDKVGVVGYCLGGRLAYHIATKTNSDASVGYYGVGIDTVLEQAQESVGQLMLHIPELDHLCPPEAREKIYSALDTNPNVTLFTYEGAGHAFARSGGDTYIVEPAELANSRTVAFLKEHLGG